MVWHLLSFSLSIGFTRFFVHVVIAFLTGVTYWQVGNSAQDLQNRIFAIFQATVLPALIMQQVEPRYDMSRTIFYRESSSKMYSQLAFVVSIVIAEIPYSLLCGTAVPSPSEIPSNDSTSLHSTSPLDSTLQQTVPAINS
jgi:ABC-type multidrug transport system permease subunit